MESTAETVKSMLSGLKKVPTDYDTYANNMINACRKAEQCLQEHTKELTEYAGFVEEMDDEMQTRFRECIMKGYESLLDSRFLDQKDLFESYIDNLRTADLGYSEEKLVSLECVARELYGLGYETEFIAGVLGNIVSEANAGQFENSNYKSCPEKKTDYLEHMDNTYGYRTAFSNQNIQQKGIEATEELLTDIKNDPNAMFGLGCVQWTGTRTMELIECYKEICGENKFPSMEQCCQAEALMIRKELSSDGEYGNVYQDWKNNCSNNDFIESVRQASKIVCDDYEKPKDKNYDYRADQAEKIYLAMIGEE